ncbi:tyrosine-type recombinase/integrase [Pseudoduganella umbonata]|uniref:Site-specific recombinase XerD n=1 Tax=Pseudoduganella umbonata TaxID=864828 RepID=A0A4P8HLU1_9BURK|nr:site-specific integrase [Pseudoduganella umbonata]MBB3219893.1 site-specific recombinase XerD [Pseudoduganella umbonata]QCP09916.1 hypothetical protein FCL38_05375 [Pseudoduganella umbonata]
MPVQLCWSAQCFINGAYYSRIPYLLSHDFSIIEAATDWFRELATKCKLSGNTCGQYAYTLTAFFDYLDKQKIEWHSVTDFILERWRGYLTENAPPVTNKTWNRSLGVVLAFFNWAQDHGHIRNHIGEGKNGVLPPICILISKVRGRTIITSKLGLRGSTQFRPIPTDTEMEDAYAELSNIRPDLAARNVLLLRWAEAGLRRDEFRCMSITDLPSHTQIATAERENRLCTMDVIGKGNRKRNIVVDPELILATREYIEVERADVVARAHNVVPEMAVFISHTRGLRLSGSFISHLLSASFKNSDRFAKLTGHRARGRYLTKLCEAYIDEHMHVYGTLDGLHADTILFRVAEQAGHRDIRSLRYYLRLGLRRAHQRLSHRPERVVFG